MSRKVEIYTVLGLVIALLACIAAWTALPQIQRLFGNSSTSGISQASSPIATAPTTLGTVQISAPPTAEPATAIPTATNTPTPTAPPTPTQIPTPTHKPGDVLYQADWAKGMNGWASSPGWKVVNGMLVNDGTGINSSIWAPYQPEGVADYAVETEVQLVRDECGTTARVGVITRGDREGGYVAGFTGPCYHGTIDATIMDRAQGQIAAKSFTYNTEWHTYRVEVKGNTIRFLVDGARVLDATDNRYLNAGEVGLWVSDMVLNIRSFKVIML